MPEAIPYINLDIALILGVSLVALIVLGIFVLIGMKIMRNGKRKSKTLPEDEEARMIQEIYQGMVRMEERVESLETILFDREKGSNRDES